MNDTDSEDKETMQALWDWAKALYQRQRLLDAQESLERAWSDLQRDVVRYAVDVIQSVHHPSEPGDFDEPGTFCAACSCCHDCPDQILIEWPCAAGLAADTLTGLLKEETP